MSEASVQQWSLRNERYWQVKNPNQTIFIRLQWPPFPLTVIASQSEVLKGLQWDSAQPEEALCKIKLPHLSFLPTWTTIFKSVWNHMMFSSPRDEITTIWTIKPLIQLVESRRRRRFTQSREEIFPFKGCLKACHDLTHWYPEKRCSTECVAKNR